MDRTVELLTALANDTPLTTSSEGLDDGCHFCGADTKYRTGSELYAIHEHNCPWILARRFLHMDIGIEQVQPWKWQVVVAYVNGHTMRPRYLAFENYHEAEAAGEKLNRPDSKVTSWYIDYTPPWETS